MDNFYVTLLSSEGEKYGENGISSFKTTLNIPLTLPKNEYEVALSSISFPKSYYNIYDYNNKLIINHENNSLDETLEKGYYSNAEKLCKEITKHYANTWYNDRNYTFQFTLIPHSKIEFSGNLAGILGFKKSEFITYEDTKTFYGDYPVDVNFSRYYVFVYCDVIENTIIGDKNAPLLQALPVGFDEKHSSTTSYYFNKPHYVKLNKNFISEIII